MKKGNLFGDAIYIDIMIALMIIIVAFLSSCTTQRKAVKYFDLHGFQAARYCAGAFPVKSDSVFIPGEVIHTSDTTILKGDSIPCPTLPGQTDTFFVKCPPSQIIRDTVFRTDTVRITKESTAKDTIIAGLNNKLSVQKERTEVVQNKAIHRGRLMWGTWIILLLAGGVWLFLKGKLGVINSIIEKLK